VFSGILWSESIQFLGLGIDEPGIGERSGTIVDELKKGKIILYMYFELTG